MNISPKVLAVIGTIVVLGVLGVVFYEIHSVHARQDAIEQSIVEQKQLADGITRAMATWATKDDLVQLAKNSNLNLDEITKDLKNFHATVDAINTSSAISQGQVLNNLPSTSFTKTQGLLLAPSMITCNGKQIACSNQDPFGYQSTTQQLALNENFGTLKVPFGDVGFTASQKDPWNINVSSRKYNATTVIGLDENQKMYAYNKLSINVNNKDYDVPVSISKITQEYPMPTFSWLNARLFLGLDIGMSLAPIQAIVGPSLNIQMMSYGKFKNQPDLSILQLGVMYDAQNKRPNFILTPVSYNIGQHLPLMNNLYIGPSLGLNTSGSFSVSLGLHAAI